MHPHAHLIEALGGGTKVAAGLTALLGSEIDRERVYKWQKNGVPHEFRVPLARVLIGRGIAVPDGFLPLGIDASAIQPFATDDKAA
jgi:hypothetical protein